MAGRRLKPSTDPAARGGPISHQDQGYPDTFPPARDPMLRGDVCRRLFVTLLGVAAGCSAFATLLVVAGCGGGGVVHAAAPSRRETQPQGRVVLPGTTAADFRLRDQDGRTLALSNLRGKIVLLTFLYTHCVDVCPVIAERLNAVLLQLGRRRAAVRVLAVSVDPHYDTPAAVREFISVHRLLPQFRYLTGSRTHLAPVWQAYNVFVVEKNPDLTAHTASTFLIGRDGRPRMVFPADARFDAIFGATRDALRRTTG
jgi:protein SCO1/2